MSSLFLLWMALISRQSVSLTCRSVGAVVMTIASSWVISHQTAASAAAYVLPDALQERTATRRWFRRALRISFCFSQGVSPSSFSTNATGLFQGAVAEVVLECGGVFCGLFSWSGEAWVSSFGFGFGSSWGRESRTGSRGWHLGFTSLRRLRRRRLIGHWCASCFMLAHENHDGHDFERLGWWGGCLGIGVRLRVRFRTSRVVLKTP